MKNKAPSITVDRTGQIASLMDADTKECMDAYCSLRCYNTSDMPT